MSLSVLLPVTWREGKIEVCFYGSCLQPTGPAEMMVTQSSDRHSQVRSALSHLQDPAYLETHPLAEEMESLGYVPGMSRGQMLRRTLRVCIEALDPGSGVSAGDPAARPYQLLRGRYIAGHSIQHVARLLDIGERQAYRELRRAIDGLLTVLDGAIASSGGTLPADTAMPAASESVRDELRRVSATADPQKVDLIELLAVAADCVAPLAVDYGTRLSWEPRAQRIYVLTSRVLLRQAVVNLLSDLVRLCHDQEVRMQAWLSGESALVRMRWSGGTLPSSPEPGRPIAVGEQLLDALGLDWRLAENRDGVCCLEIRFPLAKTQRVLIVDDNQGLIRLFERYLEGQPYLVKGVTRAEQVEEAIERERPDVVIIDVMMPNRDGWEVLQMVRQGDEEHQTAIIVCSIINDPELALALGADGFLHKPVTRRDLLDAIAAV